MKKSFIRQEARCYFIPFLLGDNRTSHKLSRKFLRKYGIVSFILDTKGNLSDVFDISCKFIKLSDTDDDTLLLLQLTDIVCEIPSTMPILIPCSEKYKNFTKAFDKELESIFFISNEETALTDSPLRIIPS